MEQENEKEYKIYKSFIWSFGDKPERSLKRNNNDNGSDNVNYNNNDNNDNIDNHNKIKNYAFDDNHNISFEDSVNINTISIMNTNMNTNTSMCISQLGEFRKANNKRELVNSKLDERHSIGHIGQNPFNRENNYIKDLENQQKFMIPKSSYDEKM
jgi:hypothetical protein